MRLWIGLAALFLMPAALAQPAPWEAKFYNPHPADGDLVLPMPCGGMLVFRLVEVPAGAGPLEDRPVPLGDPDRSAGLTEYVHNETIAAPFATPGGGRGYWIGKYVVTRDQFAAMRGTCAAPGFAGRIAKTEVSQVEAITAASQWTGWLMSNARDRLPKRGSELAYVRLPTEVEWEFAARGGTKVTAEAFQGRSWPMPEGIEHYAVAGAAADGRAQQIGVQSLPNPLGLYDILGSVDQMMLEPFRLNRVGRLHGDAGGVILRGGNFKAQPEDLHSGSRSEMLPYDPATNQPTRMVTVGFRVVLSAPVAGNAAEATAERTAFNNLIAQRDAVTATNDPRQLVDALRKEVRNGLPLDVRAFDLLDAGLASIDRARADEDRVALRAKLEAATVMANFVARLERSIKVDEALIDYVQASAERQAAQLGLAQAPASIAEFAARQRGTIEAIRRDQSTSLQGYLRFVRQIATGPVLRDVEQQAVVVRQEMDDRGEQQLKSFLPVVMKHAIALRGDAAVTSDQARREILAVPPLPPR